MQTKERGMKARNRPKRLINIFIIKELIKNIFTFLARQKINENWLKCTRESAKLYFMSFFENVAILGTGLLGSSLGAALKARGLCKTVSAWSRSEETRAKCKNASWCDSIFDNIQDAVKNADLIVLSTTPSSIPDVAQKAALHAKSGSVFTDLASTKASIVKKCAPIFKDRNFYYVPSHPMAGSDKSGPEYADSDLFKDASCFVCPTSNKDADEKIKDMWAQIGMRVTEKSAEEHDEIVAKTSHVPQCAATALAFFAAQSPKFFKDFSGNGFKDTTRIAKSDSAMWLSIFRENSQNIEANLREYARIVINLADFIGAGDDASIGQILNEARRMRQSLDK